MSGKVPVIPRFSKQSEKDNVSTIAQPMQSALEKNRQNTPAMMQSRQTTQSIDNEQGGQNVMTVGDAPNSTGMMSADEPRVGRKSFWQKIKDHYIIVALIIVMIIIIILIVMYYFREDAKPEPVVKKAPPPPEENINRSELEDLLERGQLAQVEMQDDTQPEEPPLAQPDYNDEKTELDILSLMTDEPLLEDAQTEEPLTEVKTQESTMNSIEDVPASDIVTSEPSNHSNVSIEPSVQKELAESTITLEGNNVIDEAQNDEFIIEGALTNEDAPLLDNTKCQHVVNNRQCKLGAQHNGFCHIHKAK